MIHSASSEWIRVLLQVAQQKYGVEPAEWLRSRGHDPDLLSADRVSFELEDQLFLDMQKRDPSFGLVTVALLQPGTLARVSYSMQASASLRESLDKLINVARMFNDGYRFVKTPCEGGLEISVVRTAPGDVIVESRAQFLMARITFFARTILRANGPRELSPLFVGFRNPPSPNLEELRRFFGDCLRFSQPRDSVAFRDQDLDLQNPAADANLARILDEAISKQLASLRQETLAERIHNEIAIELSFGVPQAGDVATRVGMSTRTMNRQLADAGTSFSDMLQEIRFARAQSWLDAGESATSTASLVFYSEVAAFFRGYRRHFGRSPSATAGASSALEAAEAAEGDDEDEEGVA
jgi:AraC-like DNA-binding protein